MYLLYSVEYFFNLFLFLMLQRRVIPRWKALDKDITNL